ncbi:unnamed protein product [Closterium sp. Naga37s-1]|nr:unnamed protein product [Closterium sp. Naga37s-1]
MSFLALLRGRGRVNLRTAFPCVPFPALALIAAFSVAGCMHLAREPASRRLVEAVLVAVVPSWNSWQEENGGRGEVGRAGRGGGRRGGVGGAVCAATAGVANVLAAFHVERAAQGGAGQFTFPTAAAACQIDAARVYLPSDTSSPHPTRSTPPQNPPLVKIHSGIGQWRGMAGSGGGGFAVDAVAVGEAGACTPVPVRSPVLSQFVSASHGITSPLFLSAPAYPLRTRQPHHAGRPVCSPGPRHSPLCLRSPGCSRARSLCGYHVHRLSTHSVLQGRAVAAIAVGAVRRIYLSIPQQLQQVLLQANSIPLSRRRPSFSFPFPVAPQPTFPPPSPSLFPPIPLISPAVHCPPPRRRLAHDPTGRHVCTSNPLSEGCSVLRAAAPRTVGRAGGARRGQRGGEGFGGGVGG